MIDFKNFYLNRHQFLQNTDKAPESKILNYEDLYHYAIIGLDDNLFKELDERYPYVFEDFFKRNWYKLTQESKEALKPHAIYTVRYYLGSGDNDVWKKYSDVILYDEVTMMFYLEFKNCVVLVESLTDEIICLDDNKAIPLFLHLLSSHKDIKDLFNIAVQNDDFPQNIESKLAKLLEDIDLGYVFVLND